MVHCRFAALIFCIVLFSLPVAAMQYLVFQPADPSENPWEAIPDGKSLEPGDEIVLTKGPYFHGLTVDGAQGKLDRPIIIRAEEDTKTSFQMKDGMGPGIKLKNCDRVVVRGIEVAGAAGPGIVVEDSRHCVLEGNTVFGCEGYGISVLGSEQVVLRANICYENRTGIFLGDGTSRTLVEGNLCAFADKAQADADGFASMKALNNTFRFNLSVANYDHGFDLGSSQRCRLEFNLSAENGMSPTGQGDGFRLGILPAEAPPEDEAKSTQEPNDEEGSTGNGADAIEDEKSSEDEAKPDWTGGGHMIRGNLAYENTRTGFTNRGSGGNIYVGNVAYGNGNTGPESALHPSNPADAERILDELRAALQDFHEKGLYHVDLHTLPENMSPITDTGVWPIDTAAE